MKTFYTSMATIKVTVYLSLWRLFKRTWRFFSRAPKNRNHQILQFCFFFCKDFGEFFNIDSIAEWIKNNEKAQHDDIETFIDNLARYLRFREELVFKSFLAKYNAAEYKESFDAIQELINEWSQQKTRAGKEYDIGNYA